jgi:mannose-6-phosphate isomerase
VLPVHEGATSSGRERLFACEHFSLWRQRGESPFVVGERDRARVLTCIDGNGQVEHDGTKYDLSTGEVMLLPAVVGACSFQPSGAVTLLEVALPE